MAHSHATKQDRVQEFIDRGVDVFRQSGARITKPRLAVLEALAKAERSLSPKDLTDIIRKSRRLPDVDLATVYRILDALAELGLVHRVGAHGDFVACEHHACKVDLHLFVAL